MEDKISVVLPVYNGEKYLKDAIQSIINQTYTNWELIIVNDCSTDNSINIAKEFEQKDERIRVISNDTNKKLPASLNVGFAQATGTYYTWTSDDNEYYPEAFEKMVATLSSNQKCSMVYANCVVNGGAEGEHWGFEPTTALNLLEYPVPGACFCYRKSIADKIGEYDTKTLYMEDHDYWLRMFYEAPFINIDEVLYMYRRHEKSLTVETGDIACKRRPLLAIKYAQIYKKKFPEYCAEISQKWDLFDTVYNENEQKLEEYKKIYNLGVIYRVMKRLYMINGSLWILSQMKKLGLIYYFKALKLKIKFKKVNK